MILLGRRMSSVQPTPSSEPEQASAFDGEQVVEGGTPARIWQDHQARYTFSIPIAVDRRVLDAACLTGYGSATLASHVYFCQKR